ncbi:MAG: 3-phosphoshikimate 1-carboxyvinyltransferase, partial [Chitinophagaceae bacterium]
MEAIVSPSRVSGVYTPPASKSAMQRACAAALLHYGTTVLYNPGRSEDDAAALRIIGQLGAQVTDQGGRIEIASTGHPQLPQQPLIDCGESGLSIRMFTPIAALVDGPLQLTGRGSLLQRPMQFFNEVLPQLGVPTTLNSGLLPISIKGPLKPADIEIDGSQSSQYLTGLLMAYGAAAHNGATIRVRDLKSKPYVDLTLGLMQHFGMNVPRNEGYEAFVFGPSKPRAQCVVTYTVEGDWSGAAFGLVAGAIAGRLEVKGLDVFSEQADKNILQVLIQAGIPLSVREDGITVGSDSLPFGKGREWAFNATD